MASAAETSVDTLESDNDYEYEYDNHDTETFYIDIDLSSLTRNNLGQSKAVTPAKRKVDDPTLTHESSPDQVSPSPDHDAGSTAEPQFTSTQEPPQPPVQDAESSQGNPLAGPLRLQILELDSENPILSYQGQVFSCQWVDMVGTNMFFAQPGVLRARNIMKSTPDFDLVGTSRIKLVGQRTKLTRKPETSGGAELVRQNAGSADLVPGDDVVQSQKPQTRQEKQAAFSEKLKMIQERRRTMTPNKRSGEASLEELQTETAASSTLAQSTSQRSAA